VIPALVGFRSALVAREKIHVARIEVFVARIEVFVARIEVFVARIEVFVARIKIFVARIKRLVRRNDIGDGRISALLLHDDVEDARNEKIDDFDASLTPRVSRTAARGAMAIELDAMIR